MFLSEVSLNVLIIVQEHKFITSLPTQLFLVSSSNAPPHWLLCDDTKKGRIGDYSLHGSLIVL